MKPAATLYLLPALSMAIPACSGTEKSSSQVKKPNIILIMADDIGFSDLGQQVPCPSA